MEVNHKFHLKTKMHNEIFLKLEQANNGAPMNDRKNNIYS